MASAQVCFSDKRIQDAFSEGLKIKDKNEMKVLLERFYELFYVRGKSLRVAVNQAVAGRRNIPQCLLDDLTYLTARF